MTDVFVIGAGPVGLTMAAELHRHGVGCRIIDALPAPARQCKAVGVQPRTLEMWDDIGVVREAIDAGIWFRGMDVSVDGDKVMTVDLDVHGIPYAFLGLPQDDVLAHMWFNIAAASAKDSQQGMLASSLRAGVAEKMTQEQIAKAQHLAREWLERHRARGQQ